MASALLSLVPALSPPFSSYSFSSHRLTSFSSSVSPFSSLSRRTRRGRRLRPLAMGGDLLGDFGARDPFPAEIESNFCENVVGNVDTEHRILIPNLSALSIAQMSCELVSPSQPPISRKDAEKLLKKVVGWRLVEDDGEAKLQCLWRVRDYGCGVELITRIYKVAEAAGHYPNLHLEPPNQVRVELWTSSIGGLSMNDFIVAARIDKIKTLDLLPNKRIWA
ncbi:probable pterin-4-alpha-carbinolamine dehydratase, chloroplastic [Phoenix dactylifera]|uniref:4a-hydroxytetrahydrobiopterin dehydratase n=1 Tax=Phoenix dactylifera TaxID=42345 RepID=A0A8B7C9X7_PHODC|nr:probable pterin-4-alpha-carbinolamine dehydratase, chloroplastic [Phoenix dactylifera]